MQDANIDGSIKEKSQRAYEIFIILKKEYPDARILLNYSNPFELLIATILSAQCTDERVNQVTPKLFERFSNPEKLANADRKEVEEIIRPTGFFSNKAKSIIGVSKAIIEKFNRKVPENIDDLTSLPGVGRKTANVVLSSCFNKPAIIVDTHLRRVSQRLGLTENKDPDKIEQDLNQLIEEKDRTKFSHVIGFHGRFTCKAKKPDCGNCKVHRLCPSANKIS